MAHTLHMFYRNTTHDTWRARSQTYIIGCNHMDESKEKIEICPSDHIQEKGKGVRFPVTVQGENAVGFVIRYQGTAHGYVNRCAHIAMELDWAEGEFFESSGLYLMCATHGAIYEPDTGRCAGGPCQGGRLKPITIIEQEQKLFWQPNSEITPARA